ncbi:MAG: hypothetical protein VKK62_08930 [Synechococcaceae cyanobacterium]|nr:hypothetical protein [Synechococcaceae cyanobacterium]
MNLTGLLVGAMMMTMGSAAAMMYLAEPPVALSRLSAQAEADSVVEILQMAIRRGKKVTTQANGAGQLEAYIDGVKVDTGSCTIHSQHLGQTGIFVKCRGSGHLTDSKTDTARHGIAALVGGDPCGSDLFPVGAPKVTGQYYLCQESDNPPPQPPPAASQDPMNDGHYDLDSYTSYNTKGSHIHAFDDKFNIGSFDLMISGDNMGCVATNTPTNVTCGPLGSPRSLNETITDSGQQFRILAVNPNLSPMISVTVKYGPGANPTTVTCSIKAGGATGFNACFGTASSPRVFDQDTDETDGGTQLRALIVGFTDPNAHQLGGIIPTSTGMVNGSRSRPGKGCEYRNGAFVLQAVAGTGAFTGLNPNTPNNVANYTACNGYVSNGGHGLATNGVIYELSQFWHAPGAIYNSASPYVASNAPSVCLYLNRLRAPKHPNC